MKPVAVIVPGIMGSVLEYDRARGKVEIVWGEDFGANYRRLVKQPGTLNWTGNEAKGRLLKSAKSLHIGVLGGIPLVRLRLWRRVIKELQGHPSLDSCGPVEVGYDWRAPLKDSAVTLRGKLEQTAKSLNTALSKLKFMFVAHSMGGVLVRVGLGAGILDPTFFDRIIYIGSPLKGSPAAFRAAYDRIDLPFFREVFRMFKWRNYSLFKTNLLECMRTFPALYYLFPSKEIDYIFYSVSSRSNPLREQAMHPHHKHIADRAQDLLQKGLAVIQKSGIREYAICTSVNSNCLTDLEYRAVPLGNGRGYNIEETVGQTVKGDGTVPFDSARDDILAQIISVVNVDHAAMGNDDAVSKALLTLMP